MAKQILIGIKEQDLKDIARYLMIYIPYNEEMCNYTNLWLGELYENSYPLVSKGMWSGMKRYYEDFDPDYEAYLWIGDDGHGRNGAPYHIKDIVSDMEETEEQIYELLQALEVEFI